MVQEYRGPAIEAIAQEAMMTSGTKRMRTVIGLVIAALAVLLLAWLFVGEESNTTRTDQGNYPPHAVEQ